MKTLLLLIIPWFGLWFWQAAVPGGNSRAWPAALPAFAGAHADCAFQLKNGTGFVNFLSRSSAPAILAEARTAYLAAGWKEATLHPADTLIFTRGDAVAAVLAEALPEGTRVTALQRPKGL